MKKFTILVFFFFLKAYCFGQSDQQKIEILVDSIIRIFKSGTVENFKNLIGVELKVIGKNEELLRFDFANIQNYFKKDSLLTKTETLYSIIPNKLGQKEVVFTFNKVGTHDLDKFTLELFFGPPNINPLTKISGYRVSNLPVQTQIQVQPPVRKND